MKEAWLQAVGKAFPDGYVLPGYPLLGHEQHGAAPRAAQPWQLRLSLNESFPADQLQALAEDVDQVQMQGPLTELEASLFSGKEIFLLGGQDDGAWTLVSREVNAIADLPGERLSWSRDGEQRLEQVVTADRKVLRNLASLRSSPEQFPDVQRWVVRSSLSAAQEADGLIADTLAYWTAAVGGAHILEVQQQPGERFETLWARLNIPRLLRWEAELGDPGDALAGAGFFAGLSAER